MTRPLAVDLACGLGGWTEGLLAEGWDVVGFDVEQHVYGEHRYPAQLVLQDILTLDGRQFRGKVSLIVASPPCQKYSYMAMPWTRAKDLARWYRDPEHPERLTELTALFDACVRIGREAECPIVIENVRGAQPWVGRSKWSFGSYHLWGDVPALMPIGKAVKLGTWEWDCKDSAQAKARKVDEWFSGSETSIARHGSKSSARKAASARIAKIPPALARHIAQVYRP